MMMNDDDVRYQGDERNDSLVRHVEAQIRSLSEEEDDDWKPAAKKKASSEEDDDSSGAAGYDSPDSALCIRR